MIQPTSTAVRYAFAVAAATAAVAVRWLLAPWLGSHLPFVTLFGAVAAAEWFAGLRPAVVTAVLGLLAANYLFIEPRGSFAFSGAAQLVGMAAYFVSSAIVIGFGEALRAAQRSASSQQQLLSTALSSIGDAVITTDSTGRVTSLNATARSLTGWNEADAIGQRLENVFHRDLTDLVAKDGTERPIEDNAAPIRNADGSVAGSVLVFRDITERRRAEDELRRSEGELTEFFEHAGVGIHWVAADGTILRVNQTELDLLGYSRDEYVGRHIAEFHVDRPVIDDILARLARGETLHDQPARLRCKDGSIRDVLIDSNVRFADGRFIHTRSFTRDVTDRTRAEHALRLREQLLRIVTEHAGVGLVIVSPEQRYLYANRAYAALLGLPSAEIVGQRVADVVGPPYKDQLRPRLIRALAGERVQYEVRLPPLSPGAGDDRYLALTYEPQFGEAGDVLSVVVAIADVTASKRTQRALEESEERLRVAASVARIGGFDWNVETGVNTWTPELEEMYGLERGTFARSQTAWLDLVHPEDRPSAQQKVDEALTTGAPAECEWRVIWPDGQIRWLSARFQCLKSPDGRPLRLTGVNFDITERRKAEAALRVASEAAESANRIKDQFLATLSHELRTPLNAILGYASMLRSGALPPEKHGRALEIIERNARAQNQLVEDLLDVSRITTGRVRLDLQPILLMAPLQEALESIRPAAVAKRIAVEVDADPFAGTVNGDAARLQQVFWNLLSNAVKFTPEGGRLRIELKGDDGATRVVVRDSGVGISEAFLPHVFEPFRQANPTFSREQGGLGIGLAICKQLVDLHGGTLTAASDGPGRGAVFTLRLPRPATAVDQPSGSSAGLPPPGEPPRSRLDGLDILVVDDEEDSVELLRQMLETAGASVRTATTAAEALDQFDSRRPDLLVTDLGLPQVDGFDLLREVRMRAGGGGTSVPAMAVTAYARLDDRRKTLAAGFDAHVAKPIDPEMFVAALAAIVDTGRAPDRRVSQAAADSPQ
jgi:PAS domain S-box-containing protein